LCIGDFLLRFLTVFDLQQTVDEHSSCLHVGRSSAARPHRTTECHSQSPRWLGLYWQQDYASSSPKAQEIPELDSLRESLFGLADVVHNLTIGCLLQALHLHFLRCANTPLLYLIGPGADNECILQLGTLLEKARFHSPIPQRSSPFLTVRSVWLGP
jgi:hypothetical protein